MVFESLLLATCSVYRATFMWSAVNSKGQGVSSDVNWQETPPDHDLCCWEGNVGQGAKRFWNLAADTNKIKTDIAGNTNVHAQKGPLQM